MISLSEQKSAAKDNGVHARMHTHIVDNADYLDLIWRGNEHSPA
jgi:hypothetical protein